MFNMKKNGIGVLAVLVASTFSNESVKADTRPKFDPRDIRTGKDIPNENYVDQPYFVVTKDGNWLCVETTGPGVEGVIGQHIVAIISEDKGNTWSELIDIEPTTGPLASWATPLVTPSGRVYVFYNYNGENITIRRADCEGWYCYKYSDDHGRTWSERYRLPMRLTDADRNNDYQGKHQLFWGIDQPVTFGNTAVFGFTKIGRESDYGLSEGWFFRSDNILTEQDAGKIEWQLLPDGEAGLRAPEHGSVQTEHNIVPLTNGDLYCVYRTTMGYPCHAYSRDGAHTWTKPVALSYTPGGRTVKNPRACPRVFKTSHGKYLFWFHNHSSGGWFGRNPVWMTGGVEKDGFIHWSQPEIILFHPDPPDRGVGDGLGWLGMSYPGFVEQDGRYWVTETQKSEARVHEIDAALINGMWNQGVTKTTVSDSIVLSLDDLQRGEVDMPALPNLARGSGLIDKGTRQPGGITLDFWVQFEELTVGQNILDSRNQDGKGFVVKTDEDSNLRLDLGDGTMISSWTSDPGLLKTGVWHHVVIIVDGGANVISYVIDGVLCDGGNHRRYGWGWFHRDLDDINGSNKLQIATMFSGKIKSLRIYNRYLRTSEAIANYHAAQ